MVEEGNVKITGRVTWPQWIAGIGVLLLVSQIGLLGAWSSPYIDELTSPESRFSITMKEVSWVVALLNVGRIGGAVIGSVFNNYLGSKTTVLITSIPVAFCWLLIIIANGVNWLYIARLLGGVSLGMTYSCFSIYLAEIADPNIRGALLATGISGMSIGNFVMSLMGAYLPMEKSSMVALSCCVIVMVLFLWLPESPHHLIKKKLYDKAKSSIRWYHRDCDVESEFITLQKFVENLNNQSWSDILKELKTAHFVRLLFLIMVLFMYNQLSGINNLLFYMESILTTAKVSVLEPAQIVIIIMCFGIIGSFLSTFLMDKFGRKILMIVSCIGATLALTLLTIEFHLLQLGFEAVKVEGLTIFAMVFFYISIYVGLLPIPPAILSEIFPPHLKCFAALFSSCVAGIFSFTSAATYLPLLNLLTERYVFLFYGLCLLTAVPFTILCVPETKGMSLQEIQTQLTKKK